MKAPCLTEPFLHDDLPNLVLYDDDDNDDHSSTASSSRATTVEEDEDDQDSVAAWSAADTITPFPIRRLQVLLKMQTPIHFHSRQDSSTRSKKNDLFMAVCNDNAKSHSAVSAAFDAFLSLREEEQVESSTMMMINKKQRFTLLRKTNSEPLLLCASERWLPTSTCMQDCAPTLPARRQHHPHYLHMKKANSEPLLLPSRAMNNHHRWQSENQAAPTSIKSDTRSTNDNNRSDCMSSSNDSWTTDRTTKTSNKTTTWNNSTVYSATAKRRDCAPRLPERCRSVLFSF
jgi:hypothetical protein